jgi:zinc transporter, ZIP family
MYFLCKNFKTNKKSLIFNVLNILILVVAGPLIGSALGVLKKFSHHELKIMISLAAGLMTGISLIQLIPESIRMSSFLIAGIGLLAGAAVMHLVEMTVPHLHPCLCKEDKRESIERAAFYLFIGIFIHNLP